MSTVAALKTEFNGLSLSFSRVRSRPGLTSCAIVASDLLALTLSVTLGGVVYRLFGQLNLDAYSRLWPLLSLFPAVYALFGLYPSIPVNPVTEIRRTFTATTLVYLMIGLVEFGIGRNKQYSLLVYFLTLAMSLIWVPASRSLTRRLFASRSWWGHAVVVIGSPKAGPALVRWLQKRPEMGLRPVGTLDDAGIDPGALDDAVRLKHCGVTHALIVQRGISQGRLTSLLESHADLFPHVLMIPDLGEFSSMTLQTRDVGESLTLEFRNGLLMRGPQLAKRVADIALCLVAGVVALPVILLISALIKIDSAGPVFYTCTRVGKNNRRFTMWKFRSMCLNGDQLLLDHFQKSPASVLEMEENLKLKHDPRVSRIGRVLRKTSVDELPQLWNVLKGEMSLVGPRPISEAEIVKYGVHFGLYSRVRPGLTGLWQVSGRSDCNYGERLKLDTYYVRNWSPWLDLYIAAKTVPVVLQRRGAY